MYSVMGWALMRIGIAWGVRWTLVVITYWILGVRFGLSAQMDWVSVVLDM